MKDKSKYLKYGLHIAVLVGFVWAIVKYVNGQEVIDALGEFNLLYIPIMIALALGSFFLKGFRFLAMMSPFTEDLDKKVIFKGYVAGQAVALLPGGVAARAGLMKQVGVPVAESSAPVAFQSTYDQFVLLLGGLIAALWFPVARVPIMIILGVLAVVASLLIMPQSRNWLNGIAEKIAGHFDREKDWEHFLEVLPKVFTKKIVAVSLLVSVVGFGFQFVILLLAMGGLGLDIPIPTLFLAFVLPTMLGRLVPVPGGFGVTEAGMVGFLTSTTDVNPNAAVAAVAIFRIAAILVPAAVGAIVYFLFWKGEKEDTKADVSNEDSVAAKVEKAIT
jgi:uncharacterized protein (TIRG00374 family)